MYDVIDFLFLSHAMVILLIMQIFKRTSILKNIYFV